MKHFKAHPFGRRLPSPIGLHPLDGGLTRKRRDRFRQVLARRVIGITVVVENCWDPHNATAVLRTCDAFGIHRLHAIAARNAFKINRRISQGAHRYVDLVVHRNTQEAFTALRREGFRVLAAELSAEAVVDPHALSLDAARGPLALVFGNEESGVSREASNLADGGFFVPMGGFTQSLNLSVTVAVTLFSLRHSALSRETPGDMPPQEQSYWFDKWVRRQVGRDRGESPGFAGCAGQNDPNATDDIETNTAD